MSTNVYTVKTELNNYTINGIALQQLFNPFQPSDAMWHHTFNSVLHMLQFLGAGNG
jgi:hypothetical protein